MSLDLSVPDPGSGSRRVHAPLARLSRHPPARARVLENGLRLAAETGANVEVVRPVRRAPRFQRAGTRTTTPATARAPPRSPRPSAAGSSTFPTPSSACSTRPAQGHTHERTHPDITVQTCFDSDRLDLGRVGITPDPRYLCTDAAKRPDTIRWAHGRGTPRSCRTLSSTSGGSTFGITRTRCNRFLRTSARSTGK